MWSCCSSLTAAGKPRESSHTGPTLVEGASLLIHATEMYPLKGRPSGMTVSAGQLEEANEPGVAPEETSNIVGRSPWQIARSRLVRDKVSIATFTVVCIYFVVALAAPFLQKLGVIDPYNLHNN